MKRFDLFGSCSMTVAEVAFALQNGLAVKFVEHESGYRGGVYFRLASDDEEILIQPNSPDSEGYLPESEFAHWQTLVYVNGSYRWGDLGDAFSLAGLDLLRSEEI